MLTLEEKINKILSNSEETLSLLKALTRPILINTTNTPSGKDPLIQKTIIEHLKEEVDGDERG